VADALTWDIYAPNHRPKVTVRHGFVTLEGQVDWYYQKTFAENAVRHVKGVKGVINDITVKSHAKPSDANVEF
jgi:osmotically-inducible protein OsmY